jgi:hypothetical protein
MLEEDGKSRLVESVPLERLRPACEDDSVTLPLQRRQPGDAVDCWHEDGWWEGHIHRVFDDRITVFFPRKKPVAAYTSCWAGMCACL